MTSCRPSRNIVWGVLFLLSIHYTRTTLAWTSSQQSAIHKTNRPTKTASTFLSSESETSDWAYPRAAVSVAVRCTLKNKDEFYYLLIQRGTDPHKGSWSLPGGKMEIGETAFEAAQRELEEETIFDEQSNLLWHPGTFTTADSIVEGKNGSTAFHYLIGVCFAQLEVDTLPTVLPADDAADAKWWTLEELKETKTAISHGLYDHIKRAERMYQKGALEEI